MDNNSATSNHDHPQGEATGQNRAAPAQQTAEAPGPSVEEAAGAASDGSHPRQPADLTTMLLNEKAMLLNEKAHIVGLRDPKLRRIVADDDLFGLALSGGGIRSATFSLGVLQALAQRRWIRKVDYLSTVSGGGYIGCWLSACICRTRKTDTTNAVPAIDAVTAIEKLIAPDVRSDDVESTEIKFLRAYSSYLTPRLGFLSGDSLAAIAGFVRNFCLSLFLGVFSISLIVATIHGVVAVVAFFASYFGFGLTANFVGVVALTFFTSTSYPLALLLTLQGIDMRPLESDIKRGLNWNTKLLAWIQTAPELLILSPLFFSFAGGTIWLALSLHPIGRWIVVLWIVVSIVLIVVLLISGTSDALFATRLVKQLQDLPNSGADIDRATMRAEMDKAQLESRPEFWKTILPLVGKITSAIVLFSFIVCIVVLNAPPVLASTVHIITLGPPLATVGFWLFYLIFMGAVGNSYSEFTREWLNRLLGKLSGLALLWLLIAGVIVYARPTWQWAEVNWMQLNKTNAYFIAFGATLVGFVLGVALRSSRTTSGMTVPINPGSVSMSSRRRLITPLMSWLVMLAVLAAVIVLYQTALVGFVPLGEALPENLSSYTELLNRHVSELSSGVSFHKEYWTIPFNWLRAMPSVTLLGLVGLLAWVGFRRIDVNTFSIQNLYRNRLVRCYLGAANHKNRVPHPYAGFDPKDDLKLAKLAEQRPYLLINAALNLTQGQDLAWQQRKAASFVFSPRWCGYWLKSTLGPRPSDAGGYVPTESFVHEREGFDDVSQGGVMVGTAMATSGAAVNSQMGFASREPRAFLLTLLNMRLGRWLPNPAWVSKSAKYTGEAHWKRHSPDYAAPYYLRELFGMTNERSEWICVSDGGHFENLGIYELVRRRCRRIICVDAGADPQGDFEDLGNAVQKCRVDFGVDIKIDPQPLSIDATDGRSENAFAIGTIDYPVSHDSRPFKGTLVYIKPSIPRDLDLLPADILSYRSRHPEFPHEPTRGQWFTEAQFESYRELGYLIGLKAFQDAWLT